MLRLKIPTRPAMKRPASPAQGHDVAAKRPRVPGSGPGAGGGHVVPPATKVPATDDTTNTLPGDNRPYKFGEEPWAVADPSQTWNLGLDTLDDDDDEDDFAAGDAMLAYPPGGPDRYPPPPPPPPPAAPRPGLPIELTLAESIAGVEAPAAPLVTPYPDLSTFDASGGAAPDAPAIVSTELSYPALGRLDGAYEDDTNAEWEGLSSRSSSSPPDIDAMWEELRASDSPEPDWM